MNETGILIGVMDKEPIKKDFLWPSHIDYREVVRKIELSSEAAQKKPASIRSYWMDDRTLLIERRGILVGVEKALIESGYADVLKTTKRPLERSLLFKSGLEQSLHQESQELFLDWDFDEDISYIVVLLRRPAVEH